MNNYSYQSLCILGQSPIQRQKIKRSLNSLYSVLNSYQPEPAVNGMEGLYTLLSEKMMTSVPDILKNQIFSAASPDIIVAVKPKTFLSDIKLVLELLDLSPNIIVCLFQKKDAKKRIDAQKLQTLLGIQVIQYSKNNLLYAVQKLKNGTLEITPLFTRYDNALEKTLDKLSTKTAYLIPHNRYLLFSILAESGWFYTYAAFAYSLDNYELIELHHYGKNALTESGSTIAELSCVRETFLQRRILELYDSVILFSNVDYHVFSLIFLFLGAFLLSFLLTYTFFI